MTLQLQYSAETAVERYRSAATGQKPECVNRSLSSTCTTVIQLPDGDRAQEWAAPVLTPQYAGKFAAGLETGLCEQAYACSKFHYFVRQELETTCRSKTGTCKRRVTLNLDHWDEQVHTLTIAQAEA